jgi:hypothetical protein
MCVCVCVCLWVLYTSVWSRDSVCCWYPPINTHTHTHTYIPKWTLQAWQNHTKLRPVRIVSIFGYNCYMMNGIECDITAYMFIFIWNIIQLLTKMIQGGCMVCWFVCLMMFNATFNNISVISWRAVLLVEGSGETWDTTKGIVNILDKIAILLLYGNSLQRARVHFGMYVCVCVCVCEDFRLRWILISKVHIGEYRF